MTGTEEQLHTLARRITDQPDRHFCVPGLAVIVAPDDGPVTSLTVGVDGAGDAIRDDTLFPIASASKLALGLAVLQLIDAGVIALDDPLGKFLPDAAAARPGVTIRALLSHTSGLPLEYDLSLTPYNQRIDWYQISRACLATHLAHDPNSRVQYSNVGFALLALVLERVTGKDFKLVLEESVFEPLGVEAYIGRSLPRCPAFVIDMDSPYFGTELEPYNSDFWFRLGTPWAGIYSTAAGLLALLLEYTKLQGGIPSLASALRTRLGGSRARGGSDWSLGGPSARIGPPLPPRRTPSGRLEPQDASPGTTLLTGLAGLFCPLAPPTMAGCSAMAPTSGRSPCPQVALAVSPPAVQVIR
jgi:beta-lactamase class C